MKKTVQVREDCDGVADGSDGEPWGGGNAGWTKGGVSWDEGSDAWGGRGDNVPDNRGYQKLTDANHKQFKRWTKNNKSKIVHEEGETEKGKFKPHSRRGQK